MATGRQSDFIIVGGGIAGTALAYWLTRGGVSVRLFEHSGIGSHASGYAFGVLPPSTYGENYATPLSAAARELHIDLAKTLPTAAGVDYAFVDKPHIELALTEERVKKIRTLCDTAVPMYPSERVTWQTTAELRRETPQMSERVLGGAVLTGNYELDPLLLTEALWAASEASGRADLAREQVAEVTFDRERAVGVQTADGGKYSAALVVLAAGAWVKNFVPLPIVPLRGQILRVRSDEQPLPYIYFWGKNEYLASKPSGLDYIGTTEELLTEIDPSPTEAARDKIMRSTEQPFPYLSYSVLVQHTACIRPATPDGLPIVGALTGYENLAVLGGAGRDGILQSPLLGKILAERMLSGATTSFDHSMRPERYAEDAGV